MVFRLGVHSAHYDQRSSLETEKNLARETQTRAIVAEHVRPLFSYY